MPISAQPFWGRWVLMRFATAKTVASNPNPPLSGCTFSSVSFFSCYGADWIYLHAWACVEREVCAMSVQIKFAPAALQWIIVHNAAQHQSPRRHTMWSDEKTQLALHVAITCAQWVIKTMHQQSSATVRVASARQVGARSCFNQKSIVDRNEIDNAVQITCNLVCS